MTESLIIEPTARDREKQSADRRRRRRLWALSIGFSLLCFAILVGWLYRSYTSSPTARGDRVVTSTADLTPILDTYATSSAAKGWEAPISIPTGFFVQSVEFVSSYNVRVTGFVWQHYSSRVPADIVRGVILPESDKQDFKEVYRVKEDDGELIGWYFVGTLRQEFDYSRYPFGRNRVWIRVWPTDFVRNIVLTPDFPAYEDMTPSRRPGVEQSFVLEGWRLENSFYSYEFINYNTGFGLANYSGQNDFPELTFNVGLRREVLTPLLTQAVAPIAILILVFVTFLFFSGSKEQRGEFGLTWTGVIGTWSAFFFATIIAQSALRTQVRADGFVYLETLHILLYPLILVVAALTTLLVAAPNLHPIQYDDNLYAKLLYWPAVMLILLVVTVVVF